MLERELLKSVHFDILKNQFELTYITFLRPRLKELPREPLIFAAVHGCCRQFQAFSKVKKIFC